MGKTVTSKAIMGLLPAQNTMIDKSNGAQILFKGDNLLDYTENQMTEIRGSKISMIFQDPMTSLNPTMRNRGADCGKYFDPYSDIKGACHERGRENVRG